VDNKDSMLIPKKKFQNLIRGFKRQFKGETDVYIDSGCAKDLYVAGYGNISA
jgi:hypothetical protein